MLTIKNQAWKGLVVFAALAWLLSGCTPAGPRALLDGQKLLERGDYDGALEKLQTATSLLSSNAHAWNYLGLAHHHAGHPADAAKAYQIALKLDPDLAEVRFNLGCLWLEQNRADLAKNELMAFSLRRDKDADGYAKLGTAQLLCRELNEAEKSFSEALRLRPTDAEALTGLGLTRLQRGRASEAALYFNSALKQAPGYPPALLNLAMVAHQKLNDKRLALQKYREYLAAGHASESEKVRTAIRELEKELTPSLAPARIALVPTNPAPAMVEVPKPAEPKPQPSVAVPEPVKSPGSARESGPPVAMKENGSSGPGGASTGTAGKEGGGGTTTSARRSEDSAAVAATKARQTQESTQGSGTRGSVAAKPPAGKTPEGPRMNAVPPPETVILPVEPVIRSAQDVALAKPPGAAPARRQTPSAVPETKRAEPEPKRSFFQKMNPAKLFSRDASSAAAASEGTSAGAPQVYRPRQSDTIVNGTGTQGEPPVVLLRYTYSNPAKPKEGDREEAERAFGQGVVAHKAGQLAKAAEAYRRATEADPAFYDAYYNLGLAASRMGDLVIALVAYETALAIRPDSLDARYNFSLVLKQADYYLDAATELERVLQSYPNDVRTHLALGNLYAQQLKNVSKARAHYVEVLESEPRHPQAGAIRYWLMDHAE